MNNYDKPPLPPSPLDHGWNINGGKCKPIRYAKPALPTALKGALQQADEDAMQSDNAMSDSEDGE